LKTTNRQSGDGNCVAMYNPLNIFLTKNSIPSMRDDEDNKDDLDKVDYS